jgi:hypothetical protein
MTINAHQFRFFDMKFVGNLHVMSFVHFPRSHRLMANKAIIINSFISVKMTGEQLTGFRMAIHAGDTGRMNCRG